MKTKVKIAYLEEYLPTPRCRKLRTRNAEKETTITVKEVKNEQIPVAVIEHPAYSGKREKLYRYYNDSFYIPAERRDVDSQEMLPLLPSELQQLMQSYCNGFVCGYEKARSELAAYAKRFLISDGVVYEKVGEPRYLVLTFGLGHNHGGTGLFVETFYNTNIAKDRYFSALDGENAVAYANATAKKRGDTKDVGRFKATLEVLMPTTVKLNPGKEHGDGDNFLNDCEKLIECSDSSTEAALLVMAFAGKL